MKGALGKFSIPIEMLQCSVTGLSSPIFAFANIHPFHKVRFGSRNVCDQISGRQGIAAINVSIKEHRNPWPFVPSFIRLIFAINHDPNFPNKFSMFHLATGIRISNNMFTAN